MPPLLQGLRSWRASWLSPLEIVGGGRLDGGRVAASFGVLCAAVFALLGALSLVRHHTFHSSLYDVGIFHQVLWNTAHGRPFASSIKHMRYLGDHFSPSLALLAPLALLPGAVDLMLLAQAAATAGTGWLAFALARRRLDPRSAWIIGVATLLCPALYCAALSDFHPEPFMATAMAGGLLALDADRPLAASLLLLVALGGKEDAGLLLAPLGAVLALSRRTRTFGVALALVAVAWSALVLAVFMPLLRPPGRPDAPWFYLGRFAHLGDSPAAVARMVLLHPLHAIAVSTTGRKLLTVATLLLPFALAPLRSRRALAVLPFCAAHYLTIRWTEFFFPFHYLVPVVPLLAWAAVDGAPRTIARWPRIAAGLAAAFGVLAIAWCFNPESLQPRPNHAALAAAVASVPDGEPVCVENWNGAHLAGRESIDFCVLWEWEREQYRHYGWPEFSDARWQLYDTAAPSRDHPALPARLETLREAGAQVAFERDGVVLLRVDEGVLARARPVLTPPAPAVSPAVAP
jgi:uncharacterized membrane protein